MRGFIDDLAGAIYDVMKFIIKSIAYVFAGMVIVGVPIYLIIFVTNLFN